MNDTSFEKGGREHDFPCWEGNGYPHLTIDEQSPSWVGTSLHLSEWTWMWEGDRYIPSYPYPTDCLK